MYLAMLAERWRVCVWRMYLGLRMALLYLVPCAYSGNAYAECNGDSGRLL